jgi:hypothetical protein
MAYTRTSDGQVLPASKINELQIGIEGLQGHPPKFMAGRFYGPTELYLKGTSSAGSPRAAITNRLEITPIPLPWTATIAEMGLACTTLAAAGVMRFGLYSLSDLTGLPENVLYDSGDISVTATGEYSVLPNLPITQGLYGLAFRSTQANNFTSVAVGDSPVYFGSSTISGSSTRMWTLASSTGALVNNPTMDFSNSSVVMIKFRFT